jgi:mono/diheme cytochrome c family protein
VEERRVKRSVVVPFLALALACGDQRKEPELPDRPAAPPEQQAPAPVPPQPVPSAPPVEEKPAQPAGSLRGNAEDGSRIYATYCASCHGPGGKGDGAAAATLDPKPANHADPAYMGSLSDQHIYQVIAKGGASVGKSPLMAPWEGVINDQGIRDLVAFIRKLSDT